MAVAKNTICLWYNKDAEAAARFYAETFPDSKVSAVHRAPSDYPSGKAGDVLTVEFTVFGILSRAQWRARVPTQRSLLVPDRHRRSARDRPLLERHRRNGGQESACGWCKDKWGISWQIPRAS